MADGVAFTKTQKRIINRLSTVYFARMRSKFQVWKLETFAYLKQK